MHAQLGGERVRLRRELNGATGPGVDLLERATRRGEGGDGRAGHCPRSSLERGGSPRKVVRAWRRAWSFRLTRSAQLIARIAPEASHGQQRAAVPVATGPQLLRLLNGSVQLNTVAPLL